MSNALARRKDEKNKTTLRTITQQDDNKVCMDCPMKAPQYAVLNFNIFVCETCSAEHRRLQHKVKGITMSSFTDEEMEDLQHGGNAKAAKVWRGTWNRAIHPLPRQGDEVGIRDFIRLTYTEKRWYVEPEVDSTSAPSGSAPKGLSAGLNAVSARKSQPSEVIPQNKPVVKPTTSPGMTDSSAYLQPPRESEPAPIVPKKQEVFDDLFSQPPSVTQAPIIEGSTKTDNAMSAPASSIFDAFSSNKDIFSQGFGAVPQGNFGDTSFSTVNHSNVQAGFGDFSGNNPMGGQGGFGGNNHMGGQGGFGGNNPMGGQGGFGGNNHMGGQGGFGAVNQAHAPSGFGDFGGNNPMGGQGGFGGNNPMGGQGGFGGNNHMGGQGGFGGNNHIGGQGGFGGNNHMGGYGDSFNAFDDTNSNKTSSEPPKPDPFASLF